MAPEIRQNMFYTMCAIVVGATALWWSRLRTQDVDPLSRALPKKNLSVWPPSNATVRRENIYLLYLFIYLFIYVSIYLFLFIFDCIIFVVYLRKYHSI